MYDLQNATSIEQRMVEINSFIDFWYGPHQQEFEMSDLDPRLPLPLKLFYQRNGRRPYLLEPEGESDFFYEGGSGHHLFRSEYLKFSGDRLNFFMEYQGDWNGFTLVDEDDPPVWLSGSLPTDASFGDDVEEERQLQQTLSEFLVTHVLLTSIYESSNAAISQYKRAVPELAGKFHRARSKKKLIWDASVLAKPYCPHYAGKIYLCWESVLVHETETGSLIFAANDRDNKYFQ